MPDFRASARLLRSLPLASVVVVVVVAHAGLAAALGALVVAGAAVLVVVVGVDTLVAAARSSRRANHATGAVEALLFGAALDATRAAVVSVRCNSGATRFAERAAKRAYVVAATIAADRAGPRRRCALTAASAAVLDAGLQIDAFVAALSAHPCAVERAGTIGANLTGGAGLAATATVGGAGLGIDTAAGTLDITVRALQAAFAVVTGGLSERRSEADLAATSTVEDVAQRVETQVAAKLVILVARHTAHAVAGGLAMQGRGAFIAASAAILDVGRGIHASLGARKLPSATADAALSLGANLT